MGRQKKKSTTSRGNIVALSQTIRSYGLDPDPILIAGGVDLSRLNVDSRVSSTSMDRMICLAVEATSDPAFGLRFVEHIHPHTYHALGVALLYSPTLRGFCARLERYFAMVTTMDDTHFVVDNKTAYLSSNPLIEQSETLKRCHSDGWAAWIVKLIRQMYRPDFAPVMVALVGKHESEPDTVYRQFFNSPVEYSAAESRVYLDVGLLDEPLPTANSELARKNDEAVREVLARMHETDLPAQVHSKFMEYLPSGTCSRIRVAASLNMSVRTLNNKLEAVGTTYRKLLNETRQELAMDYIRDDRVSITEIAFLLGFSDVSSFSRAFKRWTGKPPNVYRQSKS